MIPITILTGFLGAGKTTVLNQIIKQNPQIRFGLIVNEFGEIGIDGQLIEDSGEELIEISNGCVCCVVRKDLQETAKKLVDSGRVDYIIVETSGLAEPAPVAQTFSMDNLDGKIILDSVLCVVDVTSFEANKENYQIAMEQLAFGDIILLNKINRQSEKIKTLKEMIQKVNPNASIIENDTKLDSKLLIDTNTWNIDKLTGIDDEDGEHKHKEDGHHEHKHHEHEEVDEVVFKTDKLLDPTKLDFWLQNQFPKNAVRAKGFLRLTMKDNSVLFLFQMAGAAKSLIPFEPTRKDFDYSTSRIVLIGKNLNKDEIIKNLENTTV